MIKKIILSSIISASLLTSCVPAKKFNDLEQEYKDLQATHEKLSKNMRDCKEKSEATSSEYSRLLEEYDNNVQAKKEQQREMERLQKSLENLQKSYDALEENSSSALAENSKRNRELLTELEEKQKALNTEKSRLEELQRSLAERSRRIDDLENLIAAKDAKMNALKNSVSAALTNFEGKGLTVEQRNGKVYVSMENKLLFSSGSWAVGTQGRQAVKQLGAVLAENPDINVLIEGHTDNVPYGGNGALKDNWDLSMKRATAIVHILEENKSINPKSLTAAGRGEYAPVASNDTAEGKAKNRRIEVILTPKYDELSRLLEDR
ncbi:OmpA/MotB family protein [Mesonia aquimarina]|uniref:OmpA/MotB family protein n=1 Tax=Mesonia aquimarina TaxID=1504967 RepID=UPI000EF56B29|nr:OmpA family protein [Mesonia aquimarina]